jgi:hypothetical protein
LVERHDGKEGLFVLGGQGRSAIFVTTSAVPPARDVTQATQLGPVQFRCIGNEILISNGSYTVVLRRQGGLVRELARPGMVIRPSHDLYGDQAAFATGSSNTINASNDAECATTIGIEPNGLHLRFEGQLRGMDRFALKQPPVWYYNEYVFSGAKTFQNHWGFRSDGPIANQAAFLACLLPNPGGEAFRFVRRGLLVSEATFKAEPGRQCQTAGTPLPDRVEFLQGGKPLWNIHEIACSDGISPNLFVDGRSLFLTLLDGNAPTMEKDRWYEFGCVWEP